LTAGEHYKAAVKEICFRIREIQSTKSRPNRLTLRTQTGVGQPKRNQAPLVLGIVLDLYL